MRKLLVFFLALVSLLWLTLTGCGGNTAPDPQPPPVTLSSITVTAASASVLVGQTDQMKAVGNYSDGSTKDLTSAASWSSSSAANATVNAAGTVTGVAATVAVTITAADSTVTGSTTIAVTAPAITEATLAWKDYQSMGTDFSEIQALALMGGDIIAVGTGNDFPPGIAIALSYDTNGKLLNQSRNNNGSFNTYASVISVGNLALAGGNHGSTFGDVTAFTTSLNLVTDSYCPGIPYTGIINAMATAGSSIYLGLTRNPTYPPAIATSDTSGNINCGSLTALPEDASARIGSVVAASDHIVVVGDTHAITPVAGWVLKLGTDLSVKAQKTFPGILQPSAIEVTERGSTFIYLVGTTFNGTSSQLIWVDKLDSNLNEVASWPKTWDGDNPGFAGIAANWGNAIIQNPGSAGGIIAVGQITEPLPNTDPNVGDCGLIAYKPDGTVAWKVRQNFSPTSVCTAAAVDSSSLSLFVGGAMNVRNNQQPAETLVAKFALPQ